MNVNNRRILLDITKDRQINVPIQIDWDITGQDQAIQTFQDEVVKQVIGEPYDFEVSRFPHDVEPTNKKTEINYEFYFYSGGSTADVNNWVINYFPKRISNEDLYYFKNNFTRSFFKLDFYDTVDEKKQTNYITVILPTTQGEKIDVLLVNQNVKVKIPKFKLNYTGDKEGFFFYWLKELQFLKLNTFYMSAKFYNAEDGKFYKLMNDCQSNLNPSDIQNFDVTKYFYYRVVFDYTNQSYRIFDVKSNLRVGTINPIKWYEYVGP